MASTLSLHPHVELTGTGSLSTDDNVTTPTYSENEISFYSHAAGMQSSPLMSGKLPTIGEEAEECDEVFLCDGAVSLPGGVVGGDVRVGANGNTSASGAVDGNMLLERSGPSDNYGVPSGNKSYYNSGSENCYAFSGGFTAPPADEGDVDNSSCSGLGESIVSEHGHDNRGSAIKPPVANPPPGGYVSVDATGTVVSAHSDATPNPGKPSVDDNVRNDWFVNNGDNCEHIPLVEEVRGNSDGSSLRSANDSPQVPAGYVTVDNNGRPVATQPERNEAAAVPTTSGYVTVDGNGHVTVPETFNTGQCDNSSCSGLGDSIVSEHGHDNRGSAIKPPVANPPPGGYVSVDATGTVVSAHSDATPNPGKPSVDDNVRNDWFVNNGDNCEHIPLVEEVRGNSDGSSLRSANDSPQVPAGYVTVDNNGRPVATQPERNEAAAVPTTSGYVTVDGNGHVTVPETFNTGQCDNSSCSGLGDSIVSEHGHDNRGSAIKPPVANPPPGGYVSVDATGTVVSAHSDATPNPGKPSVDDNVRNDWFVNNGDNCEHIPLVEEVRGNSDGSSLRSANDSPQVPAGYVTVDNNGRPVATQPERNEAAAVPTTSGYVTVDGNGHVTVPETFNTGQCDNSSCSGLGDSIVSEHGHDNRGSAIKPPVANPPPGGYVSVDATGTVVSAHSDATPNPGKPSVDDNVRNDWFVNNGDNCEHIPLVEEVRGNSDGSSLRSANDSPQVPAGYVTVDNNGRPVATQPERNEAAAVPTTSGYVTVDGNGHVTVPETFNTGQCDNSSCSGLGDSIVSEHGHDNRGSAIKPPVANPPPGGYVSVDATGTVVSAHSDATPNPGKPSVDDNVRNDWFVNNGDNCEHIPLVEEVRGNSDGSSLRSANDSPQVPAGYVTVDNNGRPVATQPERNEAAAVPTTSGYVTVDGNGHVTVPETFNTGQCDNSSCSGLGDSIVSEHGHDNRGSAIKPPVANPPPGGYVSVDATGTVVSAHSDATPNPGKPSVDDNVRNDWFVNNGDNCEHIPLVEEVRGNSDGSSLRSANDSPQVPAGYVTVDNNGRPVATQPERNEAAAVPTTSGYVTVDGNGHVTVPETFNTGQCDNSSCSGLGDSIVSEHGHDNRGSAIKPPVANPPPGGYVSVDATGTVVSAHSDATPNPGKPSVDDNVRNDWFVNNGDNCEHIPLVEEVRGNDSPQVPAGYVTVDNNGRPVATQPERNEAAAVPTTSGYVTVDGNGHVTVPETFNTGQCGGSVTNAGCVDAKSFDSSKDNVAASTDTLARVQRHDPDSSGQNCDMPVLNSNGYVAINADMYTH